MKPIISIFFLLFLAVRLGAAPAQPNAEPRIQLALLLDTSGSMDGLIEQAKSQLWKMVNTFARSKRNGVSPIIEIALYEYGKSALPAQGGYIRQVLPLTTDFDKVSQELFALVTNGGEEYCGRVIEQALAELPWTNDQADLKVIIIAGNEPFNQGDVDYKKSCKTALDKAVIVNTIYCGNCEVGVSEFWKDGADIARGRYYCINANEQVAHIPTPMDPKILELNDKLNDTYIPMGFSGVEGKERQKVEDENAGKFGEANRAQRAATKAAKQYDNRGWDAVDAYKADSTGFVKKVKRADLPEKFRSLNDRELNQKLSEVAQERSVIQTEILRLNKEAETYRSEERRKLGEGQTLDEALQKTVIEQGKAKGFDFDE